MRILYLIVDKEKSISRANTYLSDLEYKYNLLKDIKKLKLPLAESDANEMIENERKEILKVLKTTEEELEKKQKIYDMVVEMGLISPFALYYRHFSQYVHSKTRIFETAETELNNKIELGEEVLICCCFCWLNLSNYINLYFNLKKTKEIKPLVQNFKLIIRNHHLKYDKVER